MTFTTFVRTGVAALAFVSLAATAAMADQVLPKIEAPAGTYVLDPTHASITWKVNHLGLSNYTARFTKMDATLTFDPAHPELTTVTATIEPSSVKTDYPHPEQKDFDKELATGPEWFNAMKFPAITFHSTKVEKTGDTTAKLYGDLNFLGVTKPIVLNATYVGSMKSHPFTKMGAIGFSATGSIKRSDFGMKGGLPYVGDDVNITIEAEFGQKVSTAAAGK